MGFTAWMTITVLALSACSAAAGGLQVMADFQGIEYTEQGRPVGMPMGGIGAGSIEISSQGTLMEFGNINNWAARVPSIPGSGLYLTHRTDGKTSVYPLSAGKVRFEGNFPFAKLTFPDLPVKLTLWCWSPFVLHDIRHSSYPVAIFDAEIENTGKESAEVGLALYYGTDYSAWLQKLSVAGSETIPVRILSDSSPVCGKYADGISFKTKAELDTATVQERIARTRKTLEDAYLKSYDFTPINISNACTRSYKNHTFGDDKPHDPLTFDDLTPGRRDVYGIPFEIIDDKASAGKSC
ncbi:MAG: GH116 family glycosyl-hydrolase, partial [Armatimonadota bacterium]|nr:GH116 family glycosyl-hydrolase [Armatimonadota bacterium]